MAFRFLRDFLGDVRASVAVRRNRTMPRSACLVTIIITFAVTYIAAAVVLVPSGNVPEFNFVNERGAVTVLSAILLAVGSGFAFVSFLISPDAAGRHRVFWLMMTVVIGYLAMDELLEFHELFGDRLDRVETLRLFIDQTPIRRWNDAIIILYGVLALPAAVFFLPSVIRFPKVLEYLCLACFFYVTHTAIDSVVEPPTTLSVILEESAKLFCSTFIAIALLVGLLGNIKTITSSSSVGESNA